MSKRDFYRYMNRKNRQSSDPDSPPDGFDFIAWLIAACILIYIAQELF